MFKDFSRRLLFSRSTAYFILSFLCACAQVILRASLYTVDNAGSLRTSSDIYPSFKVTLPLSPSPFPTANLVNGGLGVNSTSVRQEGMGLKDAGRLTVRKRDESEEASQKNRTADEFLWALLLNGGFEVCQDLPGPCWVFSSAEIEANKTSADPNGGFGVFELCPFIAAYAANLFRDNRVEDIAFIAVHVYLFALTIYTLARESIPHLIVVFAIRLLSSVWSLGRVIETTMVRRELARLGDSAACGRILGNALDSFWNTRQIMEACLLGISVLFIGLEAFVAYRLGQIYSKRPWRVVQVSKEMRHMYRLVLGFSVLVQMSFLILPAVVAMWVDQLLNTWVDAIAEQRTLYLVLFVSTTIMLPLWVVLGWYAIRSERRLLTLLFLSTGFVLLCCWAAMFYSSLYRWTFMTWWFFGTLSTGALTFLTTTLGMGIVCRRNFGKNLDHYLRVQSALSSSGFAHGHFEKCQKLDEAPIPEYPDESYWKDVKDAKRWSHGSGHSRFSDSVDSVYSQESDDGEIAYLTYSEIPLH